MTSTTKILKELTFILSNLNNFHSLEVVDRVSKTQLQVGEHLYWIIWRLKGSSILSEITNKQSDNARCSLAVKCQADFSLLVCWPHIDRRSSARYRARHIAPTYYIVCDLLFDNEARNVKSNHYNTNSAVTFPTFISYSDFFVAQ